MYSFLALRRARHLCTAAASAKPLTISQFKNRLKDVYDPDEALEIYSSFTASHDASTSTRYAQELTVRRLAKAHRFSDIENFLESHKSDPQIKHEHFVSSLIRSYGAAGLLGNAVNTYTEMTELGTPRSSLSFNCLLSVCIQCKAFDRVPVFFDEFPAKYGFEPDQFSYGILIKAHCELGSPEKAMEILNEIDEKGIGIGVISFTTILHALYKKGRVDEAERFWHEMVTKKGCVPDQASYNVRLSHIHHGEPEAVKGLIEEMEKAGVKPDAISYNYLMTCYCLNGMMDEAEKVYQDMRRTKGCHPNATTYRTLVFYLCKKERYVTAYKVFKQSVAVRKLPNFSALKHLLEGLVKDGRMDEAKEMVKTLNKKLHPEVLAAWRQLAEDVGLGHVGLEKKGEEDESEFGNAVEVKT